MVPSSTQVAAKRSPILGYNHNVKYRGLIFHVQTEDSGLLSPHLFTHLFYGGVILSTRKLVYDAGAAEDAIKGLMQAQHKVVLKDLKGGKFDDKIDQYLAGTEGLLPREAVHGEAATPTPFPAAPSEIPRASDPALAVRVSDPEIQVLRAETDHDVHPEILGDDVPAQPAIARTATPPPVPTRAQTPAPVAARAATPSTPPSAAPTQSRTQTADRKSAPSKIRTSLPSAPPPPQDLDPPTLTDSPESIAAAIAQANANATIPMEMPQMDSGVQIQLELDDDDDAPRAGSYSDGVPGAIGASASAPNVMPERPRTGDRASLVGATLPPARPITRPPSRQAISPPTVMSRPLTQDERRDDAVEVYAPAPPSIDAPPGAAPVDRPGQYVQHRRVSEKIPMDVIRGEGRDRTSTGSVPIPAGLARPGRPSQNPPSTAHSAPVPNRITREPSSGQPTRAASQSSPPADVSPSGRARRATPARVSTSNPAPSRTGSGGSSGSGGVVMTRPAVIVGAPAKPAAPQRVRKAREEEGRGFGQGLISEKSLDEVILAYLSEDADEK